MNFNNSLKFTTDSKSMYYESMYETILFDFDGTIADTFNVFLEILDEMSADIGKENLTKENVQEFRQKGAKALIKKFRIMPWRIPSLVKKGQKLFTKRMDGTEPFEGIPEVLRQLFEQKIKLGTITTNSKENVEPFLEEFDLKVFDFIISAPGIFGKTKTIKKTIKKYKLEKDKVIYVGDEVRDIVSAKKAGVDVAAVTWGYNDKELLESYNPDFLFDSPEELLKLGNKKKLGISKAVPNN